ARGGAGRMFPWGNRRDPDCNSVAYGRAQNGPCASRDDGPSDVGTSKLDRTPAGINDLGGNVAEWTMDAFADRYDDSCAPTCNSPVAVASESKTVKRVIRGGYWGGQAESLRAAGRSRGPASEPRANLGFRCAAEVPGRENTP
ncbi:MAG: formylglycine-generating enzyme family protein, partial [Deltaproteobacteria bacterium]|nr:formylglycine-generating enzyme family protein [Deltaproteobacteria bacterium]